MRRFPRHHQRQQRLSGSNRLRFGDRLGQSERFRPDQRTCRYAAGPYLHPFSLAQLGFSGTG
jgi:hypothetical protein